MKKTTTLAIAFLALGAVAPQAFADNSLSGIQHPGEIGGVTVAPLARPDDPNITGAAARQHPGTRGGVTVNPLAKPADNSISGKVMKDLAG